MATETQTVQDVPKPVLAYQQAAESKHERKLIGTIDEYRR